ncbi:hypothetical protein FJ656_25305 [Schumannella luteola]|uniref:Right handed beta helix domain-containing protein n=1 Tax=Schumannella luteola TaxID=472059 RepID=A0A852Y7Y1_9MICO|nr:right-handed parallel beta-helix repeat-containing protein [Schumannella luteola]NYG97982.1 hypothetical protein [Schumannella luteola]TPX01718.1 hypothetical protein FJ656_25305 [Schumannella luteola]
MNLNRRTRTIALATGIAVVAGGLVAGAAVAANGSGAADARGGSAKPAAASTSPSAAASPKSSTAASSTAASAACARPTTTVSSAKTLTAALKSAKPGAVIKLKAGTYTGDFTGKADGTATQPITVCGAADAVISTGSTSDGYGFHIDGGDYWVLDGFTVTKSQKGVMVDAAKNVIVRGLTVTGTGDEAIHLRENSTDAQIVGNTISKTGQRKADFGEGIYVGSAESNWKDITKGQPDRSDRALIQGNRISGTTAESIDVKEGTTGGTITGNVFDGTGMKAADSWVDIKGNGYTVTGNSGTAAPEDGFQTHQIVDGWGTDNVFSGNRADVDGSGYGINVTKKLTNVVRCDNSATDAAKGLSNADCTPV